MDYSIEKTLDGVLLSNQKRKVLESRKKSIYLKLLGIMDFLVISKPSPKKTRAQMLESLSPNIQLL